MSKDILDLAGIGIGPFNLSVAALLDQHPTVKAAFFDSKPGFDWHPGMQLPGARLQTSCLKDLVTGADPCNPHSFLNYLVQRRRFYAFLSAERTAISRREFADYLSWVASRLPSLQFGHGVESVCFEDGLFRLDFRHGSDPVYSRNLCIGTGIRPHIPPACEALAPERSLHCIHLMDRARDFSGKHVAVIGGGQSGAEVMLGLLDGLWGQPASIRWFSRRPNFEPLDETPFTNLYFSPQYVDTFQGLPEQRRRDLVHYQKLASDGISPDTLQALYQRLYEHPLEHPGRPEPELLPGRSLYAVTDNAPMSLLTRNRLDDQFEEFRADQLLLCTGFEHGLPDCLTPIKPKLRLDSTGRPHLHRAFNLDWDGPADRSIYAVNQGRFSHGIADSQLSLTSWRSAVIVNHLLGREQYPVGEDAVPVRWDSRGTRENPVIRDIPHKKAHAGIESI
ncbi:lysine N(6)-hydroxylase/L-ornithine N(5)-oxygenase family protein [Marinobacter zhanjiangensis]|uniref:Lysine 6-monooxygenase n=1 Tax=Marinobacter zhanjiangensis TaxID=578215 RepID=A0ABQ3B571_9GAMM|nr:SidA/IucD/PvdA family monooxygenase [Marinobacter zhanjiangensis]GGY73912.1 lysine 6-monooxygenase [Marinobacter zhanjiangensis]